MTLILIIRTKHDLATHYTYVWTEGLISEAEKRNFEIISVEGKEVQENKIRSRISSKRPRLIFYNGHGSSKSFINHESKEFLTIESIDLFQDTITFARTCDSLVELGHIAVNKGCEAFIGYDKKFWIPRNHNYESTPKKDPLAKPVLECSNVVFQELIKGKTVYEAVNRSHERAMELIGELIYSNDPLASPCLQALINNDDALGFVGNASATVI